MIGHLRSNLIACLALFLALSGSSFAIAALNGHDKKVIKKIVNKQITRRAGGLSVNHANTANEATHAASADSATSANSAVSAQSANTANTASSAQSADSVGGVSIEPVRLALPQGANNVPVVSIDGASIYVDSCTGPNISVGTSRASSTSPRIVAQLVRSNTSQPTVSYQQPAGGVSFGDTAAGLSASIREGSGRVTRINIDYFYEADAFGGTDDCFVQGTIMRFG
jgi:hypothetical protein